MTEATLPCAESVANLENGKAPDTRGARPESKKALRDYVKTFLDIEVPNQSLCPGHRSPMDYLWHSFSIDFAFPPRIEAPGDKRADGGCDTPPQVRNGDAIVWANRGGGKTQIAAVATLLDAVFKPDCKIRILGGSGEQSLRMFEYLAAFVGEGFEDLLAGEIRKGRCRFKNGARIDILKQSATSVRGTHVQKLRCDEVELFRPEVFTAAKFTTQSTDQMVAAMELISTMHRPYGLMQKEVTAATLAGVPVFKWCVWETIEKCVDRTCSQCRLWCDCQGRARSACGYLKIDDCITQMRRSSRPAWESEMLCLRPSLENVVFRDFDPDVHIRSVDYSPNLPLYRTLDFGYRSPFVCLWIQVDSEGVVRIIDEYVHREATVEAHVRTIKGRPLYPEDRVAATYCDPSGDNRGGPHGDSFVRELRRLGILVKYRRSDVWKGIELIRRALLSGDGKSSLVISHNCQHLIEAMQCYHYRDTHGAAPSEEPDKDGVYDHPIDALRYFFVNREHPGKTTDRRY